MTWAGKSLVARHDIEKNSVITKDDLLVKRPGTGISPSKLDKGHRPKNLKTD